MDWHLKLGENEAAYRQIVKQIEQRVLSGELPPGTLLPTERKLADLLNVNRSTVSVAYDELRSKGLIRSRQGSGTRVSEDAWGLDFRSPDWAGYMSQGTFQPTLPLVRRIWEENRRATNINLARGEMSSELWPTEKIHTLTRQLPSHVQLGYGDPRGEERVRSAVARHLVTEHGIRVPDNRILITAGSQQGLLLVIQSLLRPGDAVALEKPSYAYSLPLFASTGVSMFPIPVDEGGLIPDEVVTLHRRHKIRMVFVTPNLPEPDGHRPHP
ncbi:aminotransferase-like domain-containing protein [Alicyclobacillus sp. ALC3]|uniref:aminotransferase-like domain-containing protein n=1 Tax=Alicyclobacillus sp. ALC3 TaxID=2796143 RepID=UPI002379DABD|nr:PLP-dependent aminotransferase family protein [Alicyclobacillus sp. ALC3]